jgi:transglutaminase-like putative cysteine protease
MARVVIGYNAATGAYYAVGLGGFDYAYVIVEFIPGRGWNGVKVDGSSSQLRLERPYHLEVEVSGQHVLLSVDSVQVVDFTLPSPLQGDQTGLYAGGTSEIQFQNFRVSTDDPK